MNTAANDPKQPVFTTDPVLIAELEAEKKELQREHLTLLIFDNGLDGYDLEPV